MGTGVGFVEDDRTGVNAFRLFLLGFVTLFLELVLIRYLAGSIWNLGYFPNLVLLAVFVGMSFGFLLHQYLDVRASFWVFQASALVLLLLVVMVAWLGPTVPGFSGAGSEVGGEYYFTWRPKESKGGAVAVFCLLFLSIVFLFACISQRTAKLFRLFTPLRAYTLDIGGSCVGIASFILISWLQVPAWAWFLCLLPAFAFSIGACSPWLRTLPCLAILALVPIVAGQDETLMGGVDPGGELEVHWSPYQKIDYVYRPGTPNPRQLYVNGVGHQDMRHARKIKLDIYQGPYERRRKLGLPAYESVLILGAGAGNDVTAALMAGAKHVDAVEIDPVIAELGREHHPARPYSDPRVQLTIDDGRAFMTRTPRRYDLIVFALTDSLIRVSSMAQLRLENYLFTRESIQRAYELLTPTGDIVLYNFYRESWLIEKYLRLIYVATGKHPVVLYRQAGTGSLLVGREAEADEAPRLESPEIEVPTDDWPFPYLRARGFPRLYALGIAGVGLIVLSMALLLQRLGRGEKPDVAGRLTKMAFLVMGVAFLLLETKSIVQFSLLFGTTWLNTSLVFAGVLVLVLAANWTAYWLQHSWVLPASYLLLLTTCGLGLWYPVSGLLSMENEALRFLVASLMTFSPIFFANLIFSTSFRDQPVAEHIFGWNLLGSSLGGLLEYTSMAIGYSALALIVAACYTIVILLLIESRRRGAIAVAQL